MILIFLIIFLIFTGGFVAGGICLLKLSKDELKKKDKFCNECGSEVGENDRCCSNCGTILHKRYNESKRIALLIIGIYLVFQGLSCIAAFILEAILTFLEIIY